MLYCLTAQCHMTCHEGHMKLHLRLNFSISYLVLACQVTWYIIWYPKFNILFGASSITYIEKKFYSKLMTTII